MMAKLSTPDFEITPFFEMTPDLVCIAGKDGFFKKVNHSVIETLEYTEQELFSCLISSFIHPDDRELTEKKRKKLLHGQPLVNFQNRYVSKTGKIIWLHWTSIYFPERKVVFAIAKDVTERKKIENEVEEKYTKFKNLTDYFKKSIEKDRKSLAAELHEELAQLASSVNVDIDWINENTPGMSAASKSRIEHARAISELLVSTIRRLSFSISPRMLEDLGLNETLKWVCQEFSVLNGIPCSFESTTSEEDLTQEVKLDFFRICQESLRNIMYHAGAASVKISMRHINDEIHLSITDDGKGFNVEQQKQNSGLTGIRERTISINGTLTINSEAGKGTTISVSVPVNKD